MTVSRDDFDLQSLEDIARTRKGTLRRLAAGLVNLGERFTQIETRLALVLARMEDVRDNIPAGNVSVTFLARTVDKLTATLDRLESVQAQPAAGPAATAAVVEPPPMLISTAEVESILGIGDRTIARLVQSGRLPPPVTRGRWSRQAVEAFARGEQPTAAA